MKNIITILKKELRRFFTDRRMLLSLILPGVLIFLMYNFMGNMINDSFTADKTHTYIIYTVNEPASYQNFFSSVKVEFHDANASGKNKDEILQEIKDNKIDMYIVYEEDFVNKVNSYTSTSTDKAPQIEIFYNSVSTESSYIYSYTLSALNTYESELANKFDINKDMEISFDQATEEEKSAEIIKMMLPFLLIIFLFSGCMAICSESIAGEKERGTIATLLITPTKRWQLAIGKLLALSITSLVSALISFVALMASLPNLLGGVSINIYGIGTYIALFVLVISTVLLFTVILTLVSTAAKSVKEASAYSIPVMMIVMLTGITSFFSKGVPTNILLYLIPVYNSVQCMSGIFALSFNGMQFLVTILINFGVVGIGVYFLTLMFNNEKIMFRK